MVNKRISMDLQKEIQTLKPFLLKKRKVARHLGVSRATVAKYWNPKVTGTNEIVNKTSWDKSIDWDYVSQESQKRGVSIKTLYKEFAAIYELPAYANFVRYYRLNIKKDAAPNVSLRIERHPGKTLEIDIPETRWNLLFPLPEKLLRPIYLWPP